MSGLPMVALLAGSTREKSLEKQQIFLEASTRVAQAILDRGARVLLATEAWQAFPLLITAAEYLEIAFSEHNQAPVFLAEIVEDHSLENTILRFQGETFDGHSAPSLLALILETRMVDPESLRPEPSRDKTVRWRNLLAEQQPLGIVTVGDGSWMDEWLKAIAEYSESSAGRRGKPLLFQILARRRTPKWSPVEEVFLEDQDLSLPMLNGRIVTGESDEWDELVRLASGADNEVSLTLKIDRTVEKILSLHWRD